MELVTALGIASNVWSFIDISCRLLSKSREIHSNVSGYLLEHQELRIMTERFDQLQAALDVSTKSASAGASLTPAEKAIREVAKECQSIAEKFRIALDSFIVQPGQSKWKSFRQAFKMVWTRDGLVQMQHRLGEQRQLLIVHLLVVFGDRESKHYDALLQQISLSETRILEAVRTTLGTPQPHFQELARLNKAGRGSGRGAMFDDSLALWRSTHQDDIKSLFDGAFALSFLPDAAQVAKIITQNLYFSRIRDRRQQIESRSAHPNTFTWIFNPKYEEPERSQSTDFPSWLRGDGQSGNLFWVAGRPGSGKSTLMHFLSEHPDTKSLLQRWAGDKPLLSASCFFWLSGTIEQKSLTGLLRSLLYDLLVRAPEMGESVSPWRYRALCYGEAALPEWSTSEMITALKNLVEAAAPGHYIFLLVDGLDEFDGSDSERVELVKYLKSLSSYQAVKICVSSRPWPIFQSAFDSGCKLRLENLTRPDIKLYVQESFQKVSNFQDYRTIDAESCVGLMNTIVDKASGVFLWVYLAVNSLCRGMEDGHQFGELKRRLNEMPSDLEEYFRQILDGTSQRDRRLAASYFKVMLDCKHMITLLTMSFLDCEGDGAVRKAAGRGAREPRDKDTVATLRLEAKKRVAARALESHCGGLLQTYQHPGRGVFRDKRVEFLHRTVRDFLQSAEIAILMKACTPASFNPLDSLCRAVLVQFKQIKVDHQDYGDLVRDFSTYAQQLEATSEAPNIPLFDEFFRLAMRRRRRRHAQSQDKGPARNSNEIMVSTAIELGLYKYSCAKIASTPIDVNSLYPSLFKGSGASAKHLLQTCISKSTSTQQPPDYGLVSILLAKGANPNLQVGNCTIWEYFLKRLLELLEARIRSYGNLEWWEYSSSWARIVKIFMQYGASTKARLLSERLQRTAFSHQGSEDLIRFFSIVFLVPDAKDIAKALSTRSLTNRITSLLFPEKWRVLEPEGSDYDTDEELEALFPARRRRHRHYV